MLIVIGGVLVLAGSAASSAGLGFRFDPAQSALSYALFGGGVVALGVGFGMCSAGRGKASRASVGFIVHTMSMLVTAGAFYIFRAAPRAAPTFLTALAAQLSIGLILLPCVVEARRRVGPMFLSSLAVYALMLGGSIFLAVKAY